MSAGEFHTRRPGQTRFATACPRRTVATHAYWPGDTMKRCLKCQSLMPDDESRCIRCGLDSAPKPVAAAAPVKTGRIRNGWALLAQSWRVLMLDKELLVF